METFLLYLSHQKRPEAGGDDEDHVHIVESLCDGYEIATLKAISGLSPALISRPHREKILNAVCAQQQAEMHPTWPQTPAAQTWRFVVLTSLMKLPNATCKLAVDPEELWGLTKSVVQDYPNHLSPMVEELTVQLCNNLLATQDQERSRSMLIGFAATITKFIQKACGRRKVDPDDFDAFLTVMMTLIGRLEAGSKEKLKSSFGYRNPETINSFIAICLDEITSWCTQHIKDGYISAEFESALKVLLAMPEKMLQIAEIDTGSWHEPLLKLIELCLTALEKMDKRNRDEEQIVVLQDAVIDSFRIAWKVSASEDRPEEMIVAQRIAQLHLKPVQRDSFMAAFSLYVQRLQGEQFVELVDYLLGSLRVRLDATTIHILPLIEVCVSNMDKVKLENIPSPLSRLLSSLLSLTEDDPGVVARKRAMVCVATALKGNAPLVNQYCIEMTLATAKRILDDVSKAPRMYLEICQVLSIILLQYRSRLHGRFHLVVQVFQSLLSTLFEPTAPNGSADEKDRKLTIERAQAIAKLLTLFCEPPLFKRSSSSSALVDEARKEQAHVGKSVQYILHHYCAQILNKILGPGVKEAITPGLWSIIEAMEMGETEGVKTLSAAINNSERAVLRGVYDDWRRFGKWRGA